MHRKILLVDDEAALRRSMSLGMSQMGYDTEPCENGMSALKKLESYVKNQVNLDAVVIDIRLPDIDGIKLVKIIKFKYPGIPVFLITGYADRYNMEEIRDLKVNGFMEKPISPEELNSQIDMAMNQQSLTETDTEELPAEAASTASYMLLRLEDDADFFEVYRSLYYMEGVLYCDALKGDYDILLLVQSPSLAENREVCRTKVEAMAGVQSVDFLEVHRPVLEDSTSSMIQVAEDAMADDDGNVVKSRDLSQRVCSYLLMEVEREKLDQVYPALRLNENVVFCDYTSGQYNMVVFITGHYFTEIHQLVQEKIVPMDGVLKIKEYPVINLFEM